MGLLISTATCIVLVNVLVAQLIVLRFYPEAGTRIGTAALAALSILAIGSAIYTVYGWRAYLRRPDVGDG